MNQQVNNPLHGLSLEKIIKSSLKFLRKTQWARDKVEALYLSTFS
ncbi:cytoplasmic protein [Vibrio cholerae]|nr:cytoplasmic protein [Vibrio cholerae]